MVDSLQVRTLMAEFARARVPLRLATAGFARGVADQRIVQLDVRRTLRRGRPHEVIHIWPGEGSTLQVLGTDPKLQQLVLLVQEPERQFTERRWQRRRGYHNVVQRTSGFQRRYLVGMDERHLFIAPLGTRATTVRDAHRQLRPATVATAQSQGERVRRQGEWFFLPITSEERLAIEAQVREMGISRNSALGAGWGRGRPHVAAELVYVQLRNCHNRVVETREYARGRVLHPDHHCIKLRDWKRVLRNTEDRSLDSYGQQVNRWVD